MTEFNVIVGRYRLDRVLGQGTSGTVYRAFDLQIERNVALKLVTSNEPSMILRLKREARVVAGIQHQNVVRIFDCGECEQGAFLVMEFLAGRTLRVVMSDDDSSLETRERWLCEIARGLHAVHRVGIVHRDVKPENIIVTEDSIAKVLDFGLGRDARSEIDRNAPTGTLSPRARDAAANADSDLPITAQGLVLGTPAYMSPEQLRGEPLDGRSDQFAWGIVGYELLTGTRPWDSADDIDLIARVLTAVPVRLQDLRPEIRQSTAAAIERALSKRPADRFLSLEKACAAITPAFAAGSTAFDQAPLRWVRRFALAAFVLAVGLVATVWLFRVSRPAQTRSAETLRELPRGPMSDADALFTAGRQAQRDASKLAAMKAFDLALEKDPGLGAAHLWWVITMGFIGEKTQEHFQRASTLRAGMSDVDRSLLFALAPRFLIPSKADESNERLRALAEARPESADIQYVVGKYLFLSADYNGARECESAALHNDPGYADAHRIAGLAALFSEHVPDGIRELEVCVASSPSGDTCLHHLYEIYANEGRCRDAENIIRTLIGHDPTNDHWSLELASALYGTGHSTDEVRFALNQWSARIQGRDQASLFEHLTYLSVLDGDIVAAEANLAAWDRVVRLSDREDDHFVPTRIRTVLFMETGREKEAATVASAFLAQRHGWIAETDDSDPVIFLIQTQYLAGTLNRTEMRIQTHDWLAKELARPGASPGNAWIWAEAAMVRDGEDARSAIAELPAYLPLPDPLTRRANFDQRIGDAFVGAGRPTEGLPFLRRAAKSCRAAEYPFAVIGANLSLGRELWSSGDVAGACSAWARVLRAWGGTRFVSGARASALSFSAGCPASNSESLQP